MQFSRLSYFDECCIIPAIPFWKGNFMKIYISNTGNKKESISLLNIYNYILVIFLHSLFILQRPWLQDLSEL